MRKTAWLLAGATLLFGLQIDVEYLKQQLAQRPDDTKTMLLLAKYYLEQNQTDQADAYIQKILSLEPKNRRALELQARLERLDLERGLLRKYGSLQKAIAALAANKQYDKLERLAHTLQARPLDDETRLALARALLEAKRYALALKPLEPLKDKQNPAYHEIAGLACHYMGDEACAQSHFEALLSSSEGKRFFEPLLQIYAKEGRAQKYKELLLRLKQVDPTNPKIAEYEQTLQKLERQVDKEAYERFKKEPTYQRLENLVFRYYKEDPYAIFDLFRHYFAHHPLDQKALTLFGRITTWRGDISLPDDLLTKVARSKNYEAKLLVGKALSWRGEYDRALPFLLEVMQKGNDQQRYEAKKAIAFIYKWQNKNEEAKKLFEQLAAQNPDDRQVQEALDVLGGRLKKWIEHYKKALEQEPNNSDYLLRLAQYHKMLGNIEEAQRYYERYLKLRPDDLEIHKFLGDLYLEQKRYKEGFGHLEYYAQASSDPKALIELAKRYHWYGFDKEALETLDELLRKEPANKEARALKAQILKQSPRYLLRPKAATAPATPQKNDEALRRYFERRAQKILDIADELYFAGHYGGSLPYFRDYLSLKPQDHSARERYAFALEHAKAFDKAAAEFYLLLRQKEDLIWSYHYAYNLAKIGKKEEAKKILQKLKNSLPKPLPPFLAHFLDEWKRAWESLDIERYASFYDPARFGAQWRRKKARLFAKNGFVRVQIQDPVLISQKGDLYIVRFYQIYASRLKKDRGYKTLAIRCDEKGCKIVSERWVAAEHKDPALDPQLPKLVDELLMELSNKKQTTAPQKKSASTQPPQKKTPPAPATAQKSLTSTAKPKRFLIEPQITYFEDNQQTRMRIYALKAQERINDDLNLTAGVRRYSLDQQHRHADGQEYRVGVRVKDILASYVLDDSGDKRRHGYAIATSWRGATISLSRLNAVYEKRTICSKELMKTKLSVSTNTTLWDRDLWMRADLAKIGDDYEKTFLYDYVVWKKEYSQDKKIWSSVAGWYQFHSRTTECYYSPSKTDATLAMLHWSAPVGPKMRLRLKGGAGYSFWDESLLYNLGMRVEGDAPLPFDIGCDYSNSSTRFQGEGYRSLECFLRMRKAL